MRFIFAIIITHSESKSLNGFQLPVSRETVIVWVQQKCQYLNK